MPAEPHPADTSTHVEAEAPPPVPELPVELAVHQALLIAILARFAACFGKPLDQARPILIGLWGEFRTKAKARGFTFEVRWLGEALDETEKAKAGRKIKGSPWVYFRGILEKYAQQGGPVRDGPTEHQARATLEELAGLGWTIVLKSDGTAGTGKDPSRCVCVGGASGVAASSYQRAGGPDPCLAGGASDGIAVVQPALLSRKGGIACRARECESSAQPGNGVSRGPRSRPQSAVATRWPPVLARPRDGLPSDVGDRAAMGP